MCQNRRKTKQKKSIPQCKLDAVQTILENLNALMRTKKNPEELQCTLTRQEPMEITQWKQRPSRNPNCRHIQTHRASERGNTDSNTTQSRAVI